MCDLKNHNWISGSGDNVAFEDIVTIVKDCVDNGSKVFIGSDSFTSKNKVNFATAICLYGSDVSRYFFSREYLPKNKYSALVTRITEEVRRSVELAEYLMDSHNIDQKNIELHIDVSPFNLKSATSKFSDMLKGYVIGAGFECRIKPNAWASQTVADRHSK
ncbi:MAG: hypothetical protein CBD26_03885 [Candidatus Pelagibacter sp. TMED166]|nr:MAG: hypothetical protein CBD26_03885 [Candidatus Pelagibacter sp. TMED166]|tara:strand:- start:12787 stop:13269 length:483 start_codon:yes stop_codon:yes gene_type:complete